MNTKSLFAAAALRYVDANIVKTYKSFIVDPNTAEAVTSAFHKDIVTKLEAANFNVVHTPGPGVARLRVESPTSTSPTRC